jgi:hypothetical protein
MYDAAVSYQQGRTTALMENLYCLFETRLDSGFEMVERFPAGYLSVRRVEVNLKGRFGFLVTRSAAKIANVESPKAFRFVDGNSFGCGYDLRGFDRTLLVGTEDMRDRNVFEEISQDMGLLNTNRI